MNNWKGLMITACVLVVMSSVPAARGQSPQPPTNSVPSSPNSGTGVKSVPPAVAGGLSRPASAGGQKISVKPESVDGQVEPPATAGGTDMISACMAAAVELQATRILVTSLDNEKRILGERLETEKRTTTILTELNHARKAETDALRTTVAAKNETVAAKDAVIASQDKLVETLKQRKTSPLRRLGDILLGAAAALILR